MGIDNNYYIGPYVTAKIQVQNQNYDSCENQGHNFLPGMEYCPQCGTHKNNRIREYTRNIIPSNWEENFHKGLFSDFLTSTSIVSDPSIQEQDGKKIRTYVYIPNRCYKELNIPKILDEYSVVNFQDLKMQETIEKFKELFSEELQYMNQWFEIEVNFGFISYYS